jgi:hypothetical protein
MLTRLALIFSVVAVGLALNGCTRCGSIWTIRRNRRSLAPKALRRSPASRTIFGAQACYAWCRGRRGGKSMGKCRERSMKVFRIAALVALLTAPAYAQTPNINLMPELQSKSPEEKEREEAQQKAYKESLKKIPDAKASSDPWGNVRSVDTPKASAPAKPRTKTGSTAN